ncbi:MAG: thioredoxin family protein [Pseudomonadota bacterium]
MIDIKKLLFMLLAASFLIGCGDKPAGPESGVSTAAASQRDGSSAEIPVPGRVTMVDLGADSCVPCKMMAPILVELEREYRGRAAIVFLDVWKDKAPAERFGIRAIPTQIFFDQKGGEVFRHVGFMSKDDITAQLKTMGVE